MPPSSTARRWPARCASPPPNWASWKPRSPAPPTARSGWSWRFSSGSRRSVIAQSAPIKECAEALAELDVASALAQLAAERDYARPQVDDSLDFVIEGGRHPVVEQALARDGTPFVANDCDLSPPKDAAKAGRIWLITGPNMAGKSTFLRQNALIAILAQMGSFVPAQARAYRRGRPAVLARRRRRRSGARALDLHGRDGGDRRHPQSGGRALAGDPGRDRPRHRDLRRPVDRLGDGRASARRQPMPRAVRHPFPRADRARRRGSTGCTTPRCG